MRTGCASTFSRCERFTETHPNWPQLAHRPRATSPAEAIGDVVRERAPHNSAAPRPLGPTRHFVRGAVRSRSRSFAFVRVRVRSRYADAALNDRHGRSAGGEPPPVPLLRELPSRTGRCEERRPRRRGALKLLYAYAHAEGLSRVAPSPASAGEKGAGSGLPSAALLLPYSLISPLSV